MSDVPQPMPRLISALLDAERHSTGLIEALAVARCAMLDLLREDARRHATLGYLPHIEYGARAMVD